MRHTPDQVSSCRPAKRWWRAEFAVLGEGVEAGRPGRGRTDRRLLMIRPSVRESLVTRGVLRRIQVIHREGALVGMSCQTRHHPGGVRVHVGTGAGRQAASLPRRPRIEHPAPKPRRQPHPARTGYRLPHRSGHAVKTLVEPAGLMGCSSGHDRECAEEIGPASAAARVFTRRRGPPSPRLTVGARPGKS